MKPSRADYCHPYKPYNIQIDFMNSLYDSIEKGQVAIFESPTGTGKSLSLICGSLTWLRDNARREVECNFDDEDESTNDDWLAASEKAVRKKEFLRELAETEQKLQVLKKRDAARREAFTQLNVSKKPRVNAKSVGSEPMDDDDFILDDYFSDDEKLKSAGGNHALSSSTLALLNKLRPVIREEAESETERTKIIFCSRTHSQLTQFVNELRRVTPPAGVLRDEPQPELDARSEIIKHIALGSRKNLCINEKVSRLSSNVAINERCLELQKPGTAKEKKCRFLPGRDDREKTEAFRDRAIATIRDIEDLGNLGRKMELCPYYAGRSAISSSEVVTLPYPLLLQRSAREALGVQVKGNIVIIDEAHNLIDAIADTLSVSLLLSQLDIATQQVLGYAQRFKNKLKGSNRVYITQLIRLLNSFTNFLRNNATLSKDAENVITAADLMTGKGADQVKPHKLLNYLSHSKLAYKIEGYMEAQEEANSLHPHKGVLTNFQSFLAVLVNPDSEGRFFVSKQDTDVQVRYVLLDPREHFRDVVEQARSVILAGGTMSPMSDYKDYLFSYLEAGRLSTSSFGHVIPEENLLARSIAETAAGVEFDFTFAKRGNKSMILELGSLLVKICHLVPDGVVVFFPSYEYLAQVTALWKGSNMVNSVMSSLSAIKKVFEEAKNAPSESLLQQYTETIDKGQGAIMLSVVGGKLSEGINFSDKLGRAVVAVGLPFPNIYSAEWKAKIGHVEQAKYVQCKNLGSLSEDQARSTAKAAGREFYENACMRAVNQSIGRAIRHRNDYAAILLVDRRFATPRIRSKLPQWIQGSGGDSNTATSWSVIEKELKMFFQSRT